MSPNRETGSYTPTLNVALLTIIVSTQIFHLVYTNKHVYRFIISVMKVEVIMMVVMVMMMVYYLEGCLW